MKLNRSKKGFTLVEIMIVVVIIGLLAAMAIPAFQKVRKNSLGKTMLNDARQLAGAAQQLLLQYPTLSGNLTIGYDAATGVVNYVDSNSGANLQDYLQKISKGYGQGDIIYNPAANGNTNAFVLSLGQLAPSDVGSSATGNAGANIGFDTEGKVL